MKETEELLRGAAEDTGTTVETSDDEFGYRWVVLATPTSRTSSSRSTPSRPSSRPAATATACWPPSSRSRRAASRSTSSTTSSAAASTRSCPRRASSSATPSASSGSRPRSARAADRAGARALVPALGDPALAALSRGDGPRRRRRSSGHRAPSAAPRSVVWATSSRSKGSRWSRAACSTYLACCEVTGMGSKSSRSSALSCSSSISTFLSERLIALLPEAPALIALGSRSSARSEPCWRPIALAEKKPDGDRRCLAAGAPRVVREARGRIVELGADRLAQIAPYLPLSPASPAP